LVIQQLNHLFETLKLDLRKILIELLMRDISQYCVMTPN